MMKRRGFLGAILAAGMAPAVGHAGILMPVKKIVTPLPIAEAAAWFKAQAEMSRITFPDSYVLFVHPSWLPDIHRAADTGGEVVRHQGELYSYGHRIVLADKLP